MPPAPEYNGQVQDNGQKEIDYMMMAVFWTAMAAAALVYAAFTGTGSAVSAALMQGAGEAVSLSISIAGPVCLWSGFLETMRQSGALQGLSQLFLPLLRLLFPKSSRDPDCAGALSANFSANLLGLGSAATPAGIQAVQHMARLPGGEKELSRLVVMNTASLQLLPTTIAAVRSAQGAADAFDILPCVWLTSLVSVTVGLTVESFLEKSRNYS